MTPSTKNNTPVIGHVHLSVLDLNESMRFYELLGFHVTSTLPGAIFMASDDYHHHIGLNTWNHASQPQPNNAAGIFHIAICYPTREALAEVIKVLKKNNISLEGTADHGVSEAFYLRDPNGIGLELYFDKPKKDWPKKDGKVVMGTDPLDMKKYKL